MKRSDGRTEATQLRAFAASQSLLNRADGSAKFSFGTVYPLSFFTVRFHTLTSVFIF